MGQEAAVEPEGEAARQVAGRERRPPPQVDDPLAGPDPPPQVGRVDQLGQGRHDRRRPGGVQRRHVGVVSREGVEPGQQARYERVLVLEQGRVAPALRGDRRRRAVRRRRGTEAAEAVGGEHRGDPGEHGREPVGGGVLAPGERRGVLGPEEVRPAGGPVEQRATGEHPVHPPVVVLEHVGQVREGVPGRVDRPQPQLPGAHDVAVMDGAPTEGHLVVGGDEVLGADPLREGQPAGHVVVVDVRLGHVGDADPGRPRQVEHPVDVALRIDRDRHPAGGHQVAAVAQRRCLQDADLDHGSSPRTTRGGAVRRRPAGVTPAGPPRAGTACAPSSPRGTAGGPPPRRRRG